MGRPDAFDTLLEHVRTERGFDFTAYKRPTLLRRVDRRMAELGVSDHEAYQDYLQVHPTEFTALFNTVLINVTAFFRDTEAWDHLRRVVVPDLLAANHGTIRVWSAGCASGEEPYTVAILLAEALGVEQFRERVKIYATDVDDDALATARAASYGPRAVAGVPPELLERYFDRQGSHHVVRKDLRRAVIFGRNDLIQDAPISHVDLLVCRNTLMYFNAEAQALVLRRLHFALAPHGVLFLGKAEMLLSYQHLFTPVELSRRLFTKVPQPGVARGAATVPARAVPAADTAGDAALARLREEALNTAPAAQVVLSVEGRLVASNRRADVLFGLGARDIGRPFQDLELSYRPLELRSYVEQAAGERRPVWVRDVDLPRPGGEVVSLDVQVVPLTGPGGVPIGTTLIFNDVTSYRTLQAELELTNRQLESAYEELQSTNEELETTNEELQSTVEELETTNEELQSTNEELETMNEELQSMNDELQVTNEELRLRTTEVEALNEFTEAVLESLDAGVAVVDQTLVVLAWNDRAADLWGVRADEAVGRPLVGLDIGLPLDALVPAVRAQLVDDRTPAVSIRVPAVNRRGRTVEVEVTLSRLRRAADGTAGVILVMTVAEG